MSSCTQTCRASLVCDRNISCFLHLDIQIHQLSDVDRLPTTLLAKLLVLFPNFSFHPFQHCLAGVPLASTCVGCHDRVVSVFFVLLSLHFHRHAISVSRLKGTKLGVEPVEELVGRPVWTELSQDGLGETLLERRPNERMEEGVKFMFQFRGRGHRGTCVDEKVGRRVARNLRESALCVIGQPAGLIRSAPPVPVDGERRVEVVLHKLPKLFRPPPVNPKLFPLLVKERSVHCREARRDSQTESNAKLAVGLRGIRRISENLPGLPRSPPRFL
mmetsp:Transcript_3579/g.7416  ORF Transcript_3579/g.7416 Transcript_3579/m.7416 type:complete len:273 (-) Transcript_3579:177-995(-)